MVLLLRERSDHRAITEDAGSPFHFRFFEGGQHVVDLVHLPVRPSLLELFKNRAHGKKTHQRRNEREPVV